MKFMFALKPIASVSHIEIMIIFTGVTSYELDFEIPVVTLEVKLLFLLALTVTFPWWCQ